MTDPAPPNDASAPRPSRRATHSLTAGIVMLVAVGALAGWFRASGAAEPPGPPQATPSDTSARAPRDTRVRVRVLNTTKTRGLAKRATFALRDFGYDVVDFDSDLKVMRETTLIVSHTGHADWAQRLRRALGVGAIESRADSLRYVDFTVYIGRDWKAPSQPFRP
jgi:hypothetical protein